MHVSVVFSDNTYQAVYYEPLIHSMIFNEILFSYKAVKTRL